MHFYFWTFHKKKLVKRERRPAVLIAAVYNGSFSGAAVRLLLGKGMQASSTTEMIFWRKSDTATI